jgi:hypothetical protein
VEGVFDEALKVMIVISLYRQHHVLALHLVPVSASSSSSLLLLECQKFIIVYTKHR